MLFAQMQAQQIGGPDGLVIAEVTRVGVDQLRNEWIDDASDPRRSARSWGVRKPSQKRA